MTGEWKTIDSLPDHGEQVLMYLNGGSIIMAAARKPREMTRAEAVALAKEGHWPDHRQWVPTHWMPLPAPPA